VVLLRGMEKEQILYGRILGLLNTFRSQFAINWTYSQSRTVAMRVCGSSNSHEGRETGVGERVSEYDGFNHAFSWEGTHIAGIDGSFSSLLLLVSIALPSAWSFFFL